MNILTNTDIMLHGNLNYETLKNAKFEGLILSRYGTFDRMNIDTGVGLDYDHVNINVDLTDRQGYTTVTIICCGDMTCRQFSNDLKPTNYIQISNFSVKQRLMNSELGDIPQVIEIDARSDLKVIPPFVPTLTPRFLGFDPIYRLKEKLVWPHFYGNLSVTVIGTLPSEGQILRLKIVDGFSKADTCVLDMDASRRAIYNYVCEMLVAQIPAMFHVKNVLINNTDSGNGFRIEDATIVTAVDSEARQSYLDRVFKAWCNNDIKVSLKNVLGIATVQNPAIPPFKLTCDKCYSCQSFIKNVNGKLYCICCKAYSEALCVPYVLFQITTYDDCIVSCYATGKQLELLTDCDADSFMAMEEGRRIERLSAIEVIGEFGINHIDHMCYVCPVFNDRLDLRGLHSRPKAVE